MSTRDGSHNEFVKKLFQMLLEDKWSDVVRWTPNGDSFVVLDTNEFTKEILPKHFKHSNFASFVRQLNKYDFHKVKIPNQDKQNYQYGDDAWEFQHNEFRKDDRDALENIKRKAPSKKEQPDPGAALAAHVNQLQAEVTQLKTENKALHDRYRAVIDSVVALRTYNERHYQLMGVLVHYLTQAGIKLPPLDLPNPGLVALQQPKMVYEPRTKKSLRAGESDSATLNPLANQASNLAQSSAQLAQNQQQVLSQPPLSLLSLSPELSPGSVAVAGVSGSVQSIRTETSTPSAPLATVPAPYEPISTLVVPSPKFHVLLVEDDNVCIQLCRKFLMKYGCLVTVVTDGLNAISTVEHTKYDLVLMDIVMPNLDGATATSIIRSFDTKTPIIAMTGNIQDNDLVTYLQNGMSDILAKPFTKDDLYLILLKHLLKQESLESSEISMQPIMEQQLTQPMGGILEDMDEQAAKKMRMS